MTTTLEKPQEQTKQKYEALLENVPCNICGANDFDVVFPAQYNLAKPDNIVETFRSSGDDFLVDQLVKCRSCGLQYLTPRLRQDIVLDGYSGGSDEAFVSQAKAREITFARCLKVVEREVPSKGRILDIGTASGAFLHVAKQSGWDVAGCEPNRWLCQWAKNNYGVNVHPGTIFDMKLESNSFDVVTLWDVLEHTADPKQVLKECARVLKPNGLIVVNYPDMGSLVSRLMGRKWVFLLSVHLYYFTPETVKRILEQAGFRPEKFKMHWQSLELDYILFRMKPYIPVLPEIARKFFGAIGLKNAMIPYWMGQNLILARKK